MQTVYATFRERVWAQFFNLLLLIALLSPLIYLLNTLLAPAQQNAMATSMFSGFRLLLIISTSIYVMAWFTHRFGGSPGKCLIGITVVDAGTGHNLSLKRALARSLLAIVSMASVIGVLFVLFDPRKQALHDHIIGSVVIEHNEDYADLHLPENWKQQL